MLESLPGIATNGSGQRLVSKEPVVLNNLPKRSNGKPSNVTLRGTSALGLELRPQVKIVEGRMFRPGTSEIIAGRSIANGFKGAGLGKPCVLPSATGWLSGCLIREKPALIAKSGVIQNK